MHLLPGLVRLETNFVLTLVLKRRPLIDAFKYCCVHRSLFQYLLRRIGAASGIARLCERVVCCDLS